MKTEQEKHNKLQITINNLDDKRMYLMPNFGYFTGKQIKTLNENRL